MSYVPVVGETRAAGRVGPEGSRGRYAEGKALGVLSVWTAEEALVAEMV